MVAGLILTAQRGYGDADGQETNYKTLRLQVCFAGRVIKPLLAVAHCNKSLPQCVCGMLDRPGSGTFERRRQCAAVLAGERKKLFGKRFCIQAIREMKLRHVELLTSSAAKRITFASAGC